MSENIRSKDQVFYLPLQKRPPTTGCRKFLVEYTKVPEKDLDEHLGNVRDLAWNHHPYPSIGLFVFLDLGLCGDDLPVAGPSKPQGIEALDKTRDAYRIILEKLKRGGKFLDVGCMFAQDTRKLIHDGAPPETVYGTDLHEEYFEYGYALFKDQLTLPQDHFIAVDILDSSKTALDFLAGRLDVINATHVIHVFGYEDQIAFLKRLISLLKNEKGTMLTGRLTGHDRAGYHEASNAKATTKTGGPIWEHNADSLKDLFKRVGDETGTKWNVDAWLWKFGTHTATGEEGWFRSKEHGIVTFVATRC